MSPSFWPTRKKLAVSPAEFNRLKPIRNPLVEWKRIGEHNIEIAAHRTKSTRGDIISKVFTIPQSKKYKLDDIATTVWELCDGEHTSEEIVEKLCSKYKFVRREAEVSLLSYIQTLSARNLIGFVKPAPSTEQEKTSA